MLCLHCACDCQDLWFFGYNDEIWTLSGKVSNIKNSFFYWHHIFLTNFIISPYMDLNNFCFSVLQPFITQYLSACLLFPLLNWSWKLSVSVSNPNQQHLISLWFHPYLWVCYLNTSVERGMIVKYIQWVYNWARSSHTQNWFSTCISLLSLDKNIGFDLT